MQVNHILTHPDKQFGRSLSAYAATGKTVVVEKLRAHLIPIASDAVAIEDNGCFCLGGMNTIVLLGVILESRPVFLAVVARANSLVVLDDGIVRLCADVHRRADSNDGIVVAQERHAVAVTQDAELQRRSVAVEDVVNHLTFASSPAMESHAFVGDRRFVLRKLHRIPHWSQFRCIGRDIQVTHDEHRCCVTTYGDGAIGNELQGLLACNNTFVVEVGVENEIQLSCCFVSQMDISHDSFVLAIPSARGHIGRLAEPERIRTYEVELLFVIEDCTRLILAVCRVTADRYTIINC